MPVKKENSKLAAVPKEPTPLTEEQKTQRAAFAIQAMNGLLSNLEAAKQPNGQAHTYDTLADSALLCADALMRALNK